MKLIVLLQIGKDFNKNNNCSSVLKLANRYRYALLNYNPNVDIKISPVLALPSTSIVTAGRDVSFV